MLGVLFNHCQNPYNLKHSANASLERVSLSLYAIQKTLHRLSLIFWKLRQMMLGVTLQNPAVFGLFARWLEGNTQLAQPFPFTTIGMTYG